MYSPGLRPSLRRIPAHKATRGGSRASSSAPERDCRRPSLQNGGCRSGSPCLLIGALFALGAVSCFGQPRAIAPIPANPLELATGVTQVPATAADRAGIVSLMDRAFQNHFMHLRGTPPYALQLSFNASASTLYPAGSGTLQQTWVSGENWRWSASFGNYSQLQISSNAAVYGQNPAIMPLRIRTLRQAVFAPIPSGEGRRSTIRTANALWNGANVTCILLSAGQNEQTPAQWRQWYETEYCIDPTTALLQIYSMAPGIYAAYDYSNALRFHDKTLPGRITVTENGATVLEVQLTSITDVDRSNLAPFVPTAQMQGASRVLLHDHATIDEHGKIQEVEALQASSVSAAAVNAVMQSQFPGRPQPAGSSAHQREAFVNVQMRPAPSPGRLSGKPLPQ